MNRKLAIGYNRRPPDAFSEMLKDLRHAVREVYFSWPGDMSGRDMPQKQQQEYYEEQLLETLRRLRRDGIGLDLLFNANCYGADAFSENMKRQVDSVLTRLARHSLLPEVVTTTSQYVAKILKTYVPSIKVRASVNMHLRSTMAMEFIADLFDSYYISRELHRDRAVLKIFSDWCSVNGKELCLLANSACLRSCPVQTFHDNLIAHDSRNGNDAEFALQYPFRLCERRLRMEKQYIDIIRNMTWIRPEDLHYYEPYVSVIKLATRTIPDFSVLLRAYSEGKYSGNLLHLLGIHEYTYIDNAAFPADWIERGIAQGCAFNCTKCGKCEEIMGLVERKDKIVRYTFGTQKLFV